MPIGATKNQIAYYRLKRNTCKTITHKKEEVLNIKKDDENNDCDCPNGKKCPI